MIYDMGYQQRKQQFVDGSTHIYINAIFSVLCKIRSYYLNMHTNVFAFSTLSIYLVAWNNLAMTLMVKDPFVMFPLGLVFV